jgi:acetyl esterase/lipase
VDAAIERVRVAQLPRAPRRRPRATPVRGARATRGPPGLPPAWIGVGDLDLFHDEDVDYARRLRAAGTAVDLRVVPGMYHGADGELDPPPPVLRAFTRSMVDALRAAIGPEPSTP